MITLFACNQPGLLAKVTQTIADAGLNLTQTQGQTVDDSAIIYLGTDDDTRALQALHAAGFEALSQDAIVISVLDQPGALARIAEQLNAADVDLRSLATVHITENHCLVSIITSDDIKARRILQEQALK